MAVLVQGEEPNLYTMDVLHSKKRATRLTEQQIRPAPALGDMAGIRKWVEGVKGLLGRKVKGKIGVDSWTPDLLEILPREFPDATFVDGNEVLAKAKVIKTEDELNCLRQAYAITEAAMAEGLEFMKPGVKECEVLAVIRHKMTALGAGPDLRSAQRPRSARGTIRR